MWICLMVNLDPSIKPSKNRTPSIHTISRRGTIHRIHCVFVSLFSKVSLYFSLREKSFECGELITAR
jgi:hypothetical protein